MEIIVIVVSIISAIMVWRLIGFGVRSANSINKQTAATAAALQAIYDAMPAEAKQRSAVAAAERIAERKAERREWLLVTGVAFLIFAIGFSLIYFAPVHP